MVTALALLPAAIATAGAAQGPPEQNISYACRFVRSERDNPDPRVHADLRMMRHGLSQTSRWTLTWPDHPEVIATGFAAEFGSVGGSQGLRWKENGVEKRAYISFSDLRPADGSSAFWMSMNRPSSWQGRGYVCQSEPPRTGADR
jgi:hypothetical protein